MIKVQVKLMLIRNPMEDGTIEMEVGATVKDLIQKLVDRRGKRWRKMIIDPRTNEIYSYYLILVSGRSVRYSEDGLETKLKDKDVVAIIRPLVGG